MSVPSTAFTSLEPTANSRLSTRLPAESLLTDSVRVPRTRLASSVVEVRASSMPLFSDFSRYCR